MATNIRKILKSGGHTIGTWMQLPNIQVAEILGYSGYEWVALDMEHSAISVESLPTLLGAIKLSGAAPMVRVAESSQKDIKQALDSGAEGLILPMISSADELSQAINWALYPPYGRRGVGFSRANNYGMQFEKKVPESSHDITIIAQIENKSAVEELPAILKNDRLDGIMVGPYDLSASMGITGQFDSDIFKETLETIKRMAREHKVAMGLHIVQPDKGALNKFINSGYQFIAYGVDTVFLSQNAQCPKLL